MTANEEVTTRKGLNIMDTNSTTSSAKQLVEAGDPTANVTEEAAKGEPRPFTTDGALSERPIVNGRSGEQPEKLRCSAMTKAGTPCPGYALGDAWTMPSLCRGHARQHAATTGERLIRVDEIPVSHAVGRATPTKTPLDAVRSRLQAEPERYADGLLAMIEKGDARALGFLRDLYADSVAHVEMPSTLAQIDNLSMEECDTLLAQIEREHGSTLAECPHCGGPLLASLLPAEPDPA